MVFHYAECGQKLQAVLNKCQLYFNQYKLFTKEIYDKELNK
jgi:hypothetical protein